MTHEKDVENMPVIWQDHERRITTLELNMSGLSKQMDNIDKKVDKGNEEQKNKLDVIDNRLMEEFFYKKRSNHDNVWKLILKVVGTLIGAGSFIYLFIEKLIGG